MKKNTVNLFKEMDGFRIDSLSTEKYTLTL
jgi:hypothetical protein